MEEILRIWKTMACRIVILSNKENVRRIVMAHKKENMMHEMALKMAIYNRMVLAA